MSNVHVVDAIMGAGKTASAINYINASDDERHFIYVTPYLEEVDRIMESCASKHFYQPKKYRGKASKLVDLKWLLDHQKNIVTTHALFHMFNEEIVNLCLTYDYELIMDEVTTVIEAYPISPSDMDILLKNCLDVNEDGFLMWRENALDYDGRFSDVKRLVDMRCLALYGDTVMLWLFPIDIFKAFRQTFILTYKFKAQMQAYYYQYYGLDYDFYYVAGDSYDTYHFTKDKTASQVKKDYRSLITIWDDPKLNKIGGEGKGKDNYALSLNWYRTNKNNTLFDTVRKNMRNFFRNKETVLEPDGSWRICKNDETLWTVFIEDKTDKSKSAKSKFMKRIARGSGVSKSFLSCTARSTNEYRDRCVIAYLVNRYMQPAILNFFRDHGIEVYQDEYATSEMLQFIWRSAIRDDKHITIYIPSIRMRTLLEKWIDENSTEEIDENVHEPEK